MTTWTAHLRQDAEPRLIREGFSRAALVFGPFWLAAHRAWIATGLTLAAYVLIAVLAPDPADLILTAGLAWLIGLTGRDMVRWSMTNAGYTEAHVVIAKSEVDALGRLLANRPDLVTRFRTGS